VAREWTPLDIQTFARAYKAEVPGAVLTVHGIDAGLHALAAAPAASGGGPVDGCEDCAYNGRYLCDTHGPPPAAAPVSERARALFSEMLSAPYGDTTMGDIVCAETTRNRLESAWLPILEQALTQKRGECWPLNKNPKDGWTFDPSFLDEVKTRAEQSDIGEFAPCLEGVESVLIALRGMGDTTPQPSADAVRELVKRAYEVVHHDDECPAIGGNGDKDCRCNAVPFLRELESLLSAASGEKGVR
jgi:hypothetical protein